MISFLSETCGFTNNSDFILFKWRLKRKHSRAKCVIHATKFGQMENHIYKFLHVFANQFYCNHTWAWVFCCKFPAYFQNTFLEEHLWTAAFVFLFHQTDYIILRGKPYSACAKSKAFHEDFLWETADLFAFNKDIFNEKIHLLCSGSFTVSWDYNIWLIRINLSQLWI